MSRALGMPPTSLGPRDPAAQSHNSHGGAAQQSHLHARGRPGGRIRFQTRPAAKPAPVSPARPGNGLPDERLIRGTKTPESPLASLVRVVVMQSRPLKREVAMRTFALMGIVAATICSTSVMAENFTPVPGKEPARNLHTAQNLTERLCLSLFLRKRRLAELFMHESALANARLHR